MKGELPFPRPSVWERLGNGVRDWRARRGSQAADTADMSRPTATAASDASDALPVSDARVTPITGWRATSRHRRGGE